MEKKNLRVLVGYNGAVMQDVSTAWSGWAAASGTAGDMAYFDEDGTNISDSSGLAAILAAGTMKRFFVAMKVGANKNVKSDMINPRELRNITVQATAAGAPKKVVVSSVSNVDCETEYCMKIRYESPEIAKTYGYQDLIQTYSYVTRCCGTECGCPDGAVWDALTGLAQEINADTGSGMNNPDSEALGKTVSYAKVWNTTAVVTSQANDLYSGGAILTEGSNIVTYDTAGTGYVAAREGEHTSGTHLAVGDWIRFLGKSGDPVAGVVATGVGSDMFRVEAISGAGAAGAKITLDRPWPHASYTCDATGDSEVILKAVAEAYADSTWGMTITGAGDDYTETADAPIESTAASKTYTPTYFTDIYVGLACELDCNATVTTITEMSQPEGYGADLIQQELWARAYTSPNGIYGGTTITNQPVSGTDYHASAGSTYTQIIIEYTDTHSSAATAGAVVSPKKLIIAAHATQAGAEATEDSHIDWWNEYNEEAAIVNHIWNYNDGAIT
jgi:hypothetical protein